MTRLLTFLLIISVHATYSQFPLVQYDPEGPHTTSTVYVQPSGSEEVGVIIGTGSVDLSGAGNYEIKIPVPPGTKDMVPHLSIVYNSAASDGILGYGWTISGLSSIVRGNNQLFCDENSSRPSHSPVDKFYLDGERLVYHGFGENGPGTNGARYRTRYDGEIWVEAISSYQSGPGCFKVYQKGGATISYGCENSTTHSKWTTPDGTDWSYGISRIEDCEGNYINFVYYDQGSESTTAPLIKEILYTGNSNTSTAPYNRIEFVYTNRFEDDNEYYMNGDLIFKSDYLLSSVIVYALDGAEEQTVRSYDFTYALSNNHSVLKSISECSGLGNCKPKTNIRYGDEASLTSYNSSYNPTTTAQPYYRYSAGDMNADGFSDVLEHRGSTSSADLFIQRVCLNQPDPLNQTGSGFNGYNSTTYSYQNQLSSGEFYYVDGGAEGLHGVYDFTGDAIGDVVSTIQDENHNILKFIVQEGPLTSSGWNSTWEYPLEVGTVHSKTNKTAYSWGASRGLLVGDFNGDAIGDFITLQQNSDYTSTKMAIHIGAGQNTSNQNLPVLLDWSNLIEFDGFTDFHVIDFDGDGRNEVFCVSPPIPTNGNLRTACVFRLDCFNEGTTNAACFAELLYSFSTLGLKRYYWGDYNGDGISDALVANSLHNYWNMYLGTGDDFSIGLLGDEIPAPNPNCEFEYIPADFNNDGLTDIALRLGGGGNTSLESILSSLYIIRSKGDNFEIGGPSYQGSQSFISNIGPIDIPTIVSDFNGDGQADLFYRTPAYLFQHVLPWENDESFLAKEIVDGLGNSYQYEYEPLTFGHTSAGLSQEFYSIGSVVNFPFFKCTSTMRVIHTYKTPDAREGEMTYKYRYSGVLGHFEGLGYLGFEKVISKDVNNQLERTSTFGLNSNYVSTFLENRTTRDLDGSVSGTPNSIISETDIEYQTVVLYGIPYKNHRNRPHKLTKADLLSNSKDITTYQYTVNSDEDDVASSYQEIGIENCVSCTTSQMTVLTQYENYFEDCNNTSIGISELTSVTTHREGDPNSFISVTKFDVNESLGRVNSIVEHFGQTQAVTKTFTYGPYGNVSSVTIAASGMQSRYSSFIYDSHGRLKVNGSNSLGQSAPQNSIMDPKWGKPLFTYDLLGNETSYTYDEFGRILTVSGPIVATSWNYGWDFGSGDGSETEFADNKVMFVEQVSSGSPTIRTYYDRHGSERSRWATNDDGSGWIKRVLTYSKGGKISTRTNKFESTTDIIETDFGYDNLGRLTSIEVEGLNGSSSLEYEYPAQHRQIKVTDQNGEISTKRYDMTGALVSAIDNGGNLVYSYNSVGLTEILYGSSQVIDIEYDQYGRKWKQSSPYAGLTVYSYNPFNELISQIDNNGNEYTATYDVLSRLDYTEEIASGGSPIVTTNYDYHTTGNGLNEIKMVDRGGVVEQYEYDSYNRITSISVPADAVEELFTYNSLGKLEKRIMNGKMEFTYSYDPSTGYLTNVEGKYDGETGNTSLMEIDKIDASGNIVQYEQCTGVTTIDSYDDYGFLEGVNAQGVFNYDFDWDEERSVLMSREDNLGSNLYESFEYDDLYRLWKITDVNSTQWTLEYTSDGRLLENLEVGDYGYTAPPPQSNYIENTTSIIQTSTQTISYTHFDQVQKVEEGAYTMEFEYGIGNARNRSTLFYQATPQSTPIVEEIRSYYAQFGYETIELPASDTKYEVYYHSSGGRIYNLIVKEYQSQNLITSPGDGYYSVYTDHLGSILKLVENGSTTEIDQSFDAWGRRRDPSDWNYTSIPATPAWLIRGFTGHEHLDQFQLIHMNGRLYDPYTSLMLSPDNYIGGIDHTQAFNRYAYARNNPLNSIDPTGERALPLSTFFMGIAFRAELYSNLINGHDQPIKRSWNNARTAQTGMSNALRFQVYSGDHLSINAGLDPFAFGVSATGQYEYGIFRANASAGISAMSGWYGTGNVAFQTDYYEIGGGIGAGPNVVAGNLTAKVFDVGISQSFASYGDEIGPDGLQNEQVTGFVTIHAGKFSLGIENDFLGDQHDRWRSNAMQVGYGDFMIGTTLRNNDPESLPGEYEDKVDQMGTRRNGQLNRNWYDRGFLLQKRGQLRSLGAWIDGMVYNSPLYVGIRYGNGVERIGFSHPTFQDNVQNLKHRSLWFGRANYFANYNNFTYGLYMDQGYLFDYTLYGR